MKLKNKFFVILIIAFLIVTFIMVIPSYADGVLSEDEVDEITNLSTLMDNVPDAVYNNVVTRVFVTIVRIFQIVFAGIGLVALAIVSIRYIIVSSTREAHQERGMIRDVLFIDVLIFGADALLGAIVNLFIS